MPASTTTCMRISLPSLRDSSSATRSRSAGVSSTAVVTVALTRPAASSASRSYSRSIPAISRTRFDSMTSLARLVVSRSKRSDTSAMRCSVVIVGLVSTAATRESDITSRTCSRLRPHSSTLPSCWASSKTARAYLLAPAVPTRHLLDRPVDQLPVLGVIERFADDLLRRRHDKVRDLAARRLDGPFALRLDLLARGLDRAPRLVFGLLLQLLAQLLA